MARVVIERERRGSSLPNRNSKLKIRAKELDEDNDFISPRRLKMAMNAPKSDTSYGFGKGFTDVLSPIEGWLHKQARKRRPWSKVYSELREVLPNRASQPIRHIWEAHISYMIEQHCKMGEDGKVYVLKRHYPRGEWTEVQDTFYVHPRTGLFLWAPRKQHKETKHPAWLIKNKVKQDPADGHLWFHTDDPDTIISQRKGIWYFETYITVEWTDKITGHKHVITKTTSKQLNKKELKKYGLTNGM